jgi:hypothetical protein
MYARGLSTCDIQGLFADETGESFEPQHASTACRTAPPGPAARGRPGGVGHPGDGNKPLLHLAPGTKEAMVRVKHRAPAEASATVRVTLPRRSRYLIKNFSQSNRFVLRWVRGTAVPHRAG